MTSTPPHGPRRERQALHSIVVGLALAFVVGGVVVVGFYLLLIAGMASYGSNK
jgi:hypothetical protein